MSIKKLFTASEIIKVRKGIYSLNTDDLLSRGYINLPAVLADLEPKVDYSVILTRLNGEKKIQTIRAIRLVSKHTLAEAKTLSETAPSVILSKVSLKAAQKALETLLETGSAFTIKAPEE